MKDDPDPTRPRFALKPKNIVPINRAPGDSADEPLDVVGMLKQNLESDPNAQKPPEPPPKVRSYRLRDYLLVMTLGNGILGLLVWVLPANPVVYVFALAGAVVLSTSVTWVMWVLMDRY